MRHISSLEWLDRRMTNLSSAFVFQAGALLKSENCVIQDPFTVELSWKSGWMDNSHMVQTD